MKILLTGGSGFVGRNIKESLSRNFEILAPTHSELDLLNSYDVERFIKNKRIDTIIHSAINPGDDVLQTTVTMFLNIIKNVDKIDRLIYFGSGAEFSKTRDLKKIKEKMLGEIIPQDPYALAKFICHSLSKNNKKITNLRLFGVYGKYENYLYKFISNSIAKNLLGLPIIIKQDVIFDYLFIDDLVPIISYFLNHKSNYLDYNVTPIESISLKQIAQIINKISVSKSKTIIKSKKLNFQYTGSNNRLRNEIKTLSYTSYETGIRQLYNFFKTNIKDLDIEKLKKDDFFNRSKIKK